MEKIENSTKEIQYINKSKNLISKNIKNAEERISELNNVLDKLRSEKYNLMVKKNQLIADFEDIQDKVGRVDPEFVEKLHQNSDINIQESQQNNSKNKPSVSVIEEVRNQIRMQANLEKMRIESEMQNMNTKIDSEDDEEEEKQYRPNPQQSSPTFTRDNKESLYRRSSKSIVLITKRYLNSKIINIQLVFIEISQ